MTVTDSRDSLIRAVATGITLAVGFSLATAGVLFAFHGLLLVVGADAACVPL